MVLEVLDLKEMCLLFFKADMAFENMIKYKLWQFISHSFLGLFSAFHCIFEYLIFDRNFKEQLCGVLEL